MSSMNHIMDRVVKYGAGSLRLLLIVVFAWFFIRPTRRSSNNDNGAASDESEKEFKDYVRSMRWVCQMIYGSLGALLNSNDIPSYMKLALLFSIGIVAFLSEIFIDSSILVYWLKTIMGDLVAGKLDSFEFQLGAGLVLFVVTPSIALIAEYPIAAVATKYGRVFVLLFIIQFVCEYGDAHFEQWKFFRHRYSFEALSLALLLLFELANYELAIIRYDLCACLFYRVFGFVVAAAISSLPSIGRHQQALKLIAVTTCIFEYIIIMIIIVPYRIL